MSSATPADVLARRRQLMLNGDADGFADLFAPDAVMEFCFHGPPGGTPLRLEGREAIREYSRQFTDSPLRVEDYEVTELYQAQDPAVVIAEMRTTATLTHDGPVAHGEVHPGAADQGRPDRALPRLRRPPDLRRTVRGTAT